MRLVVVAAFLAACASAPSHSDEVLTVPLTSATYVANGHAIHLLSGARCRHEAECGHSTTGCFDKADLDERSSIGIDACPFGVAQDRLDRCIEAIARGRCRLTMSSVIDVAGCQRTELCR